MKYPVFKATDWRDRLDELEAGPNPFKLFVAAHLRAQATERDDAERERHKLRLLLLATERKMEEGEIRSWQRLLDWLMPLPREAQARVEEAFYVRTGGKPMPFVAFFERREMEAEAKGQARGLRCGTLLALKFGEAGAALVPRLAEADAAAVEAVFAALEGDAGLDEIGKLLPDLQNAAS